MRTLRINALRSAITVLAILCLSLFPASSAFADGATTYTVMVKDFTEGPFGIELCSIPGDLTVTYNGVIHETLLPNGTGHFVTALTGDFVFATAPAIYTGHFSGHAGFNSNAQNAADTTEVTFLATGSDGSSLKIQIRSHFNMSASGIINFFSIITCG